MLESLPYFFCLSRIFFLAKIPAFAGMTKGHMLIDGNDIIKTEFESLKVRLYEPDDLIFMLQEAGFKNIRMLKAFDSASVKHEEKTIRKQLTETKVKQQRNSLTNLLFISMFLNIQLSKIIISKLN